MIGARLCERARLGAYRFSYYSTITDMDVASNSMAHAHTHKHVVPLPTRLHPLTVSAASRVFSPVKLLFFDLFMLP